MSPWKKRPQADHYDIAARAKAAPGTWVLAQMYGSTYSANAIARFVRSGYRLPAYLPSLSGRFEPRIELTADAVELWVRYLPVAATLTAGGAR